jgi:hypothetical protein
MVTSRPSKRSEETPAGVIEDNIRAVLLHPGFIRLSGHQTRTRRWILQWSSELPPAGDIIAATSSWHVYCYAVEAIYQALRARQVQRKPPGIADFHTLTAHTAHTAQKP